MVNFKKLSSSITMTIKKPTTWLLTICICVTQALSPDVARAVELSLSTKQESPGSASWIPSPALGSIINRDAAPKSRGTIIHIQDAHAVYDAQKNIQSLLEEMKSSIKMDEIFLEGGAGKLDPELKHLFKGGKKLSQAEREAWMRSGDLTGAEAFLMKNSQVEGYGVEDVKEYWNNVDQYKRVYVKESTSDAFLQAWLAQWKNATIHLFKPALRKYLDVYAKAGKEAEATSDWFDALRIYAAEEWKCDLSSREEQVEFPMLARYSYVRKTEKSIDLSAAEQERKEFLVFVAGQGAQSAKLKAALKEVETLIQKFKNRETDFGDPRNVFERLAEFLPKDFSMARWPNLKKIFEQIILSAEINPVELQKEAKRLHVQIIKKDAATVDARSAAILLEKYLLLHKLLHLQLSRSEYSQLSRRAVHPIQLSKAVAALTSGDKKIKENDFAALEQTYADAVRFYQGAIQREAVMESAMIRELQNKKSKNIALVTGGFHTNGMREFAQKNHFNYVGIMPRISKITAEDQDHYHRALLGEAFLNLKEKGLSEAESSQVGAAIITSLRMMDDPRAATRVARMIRHKPPVGAGLSARSEARDFAPKLEAYFASLPDNDLRNHRLLPAILAVMRHKKDLKARGIDLQSALRESTGKVSRKIPVIEQVADGVYVDFNLKDLPLAHRMAFAMAVYDRDEFPAVSRFLETIVEKLDLAKRYPMSDRLSDAQDYKKVTDLFWNAEQELTTVQNIMLQHAINKMTLSMPRYERRALEKEALVMEMMKEREAPGKGDIPQIVFITDYHGSTRIGSMIGHALGLKNYQNIRTNEDLESRLKAEKIDVSKKNILFVGGSDYVDRGPEPLSGFRFNEFLRKHGKLRFINGNHEWWKDWNILGMHLRVNDVVREIANNDLMSLEVAFEKVWQFVTTINWTQAQIDAEKTRIRGLVSGFMTKSHQLFSHASERDVQEFANMIIDSGTNPNHSLEWWAREWYEHSQWADVFLDQLNAELLNSAVDQIHQRLDGPQLTNLADAIEASTILSAAQKQILKDRIRKTGRLFETITSESFAKSENVKRALEDVEKLKQANASIRTSNEQLAAAGRHSEMQPQHKVPTAFELTSNEAKEMLAEVTHVIQEVNKEFHRLGISEIEIPKVDLVEPQNYRVNPVVMESALWDFKNMALMFTDVMENFYVHGIIPVTADKKEFNVRYRDLKGVDAIERLQYDIRIFFDSLDKIEDTPEFRARVHAELGEAFAVVNEWYSDTLAFLKPASIRGFIDQGGPEEFPYEYVSATSPRTFKGSKGIVHVGHVEAGKLRKEGLSWWQGGIRGGLAHGDYEASEGGYAGLGAYVSHFKRDENGNLTGITRLGYAETVANYKKQIKKKEKELKAEQGKGPQTTGLADKLSAEIGVLQGLLENVEKTGDVITDLTLSERDLSAVERREIEPLTQGTNLLDYYVIRFLTENIESYRLLGVSAAQRGLTRRLQYYEQKRSWSERKLKDYLEKHAASINSEIKLQAARSEVRTMSEAQVFAQGSVAPKPLLILAGAGISALVLWIHPLRWFALLAGVWAFVAAIFEAIPKPRRIYPAVKTGPDRNEIWEALDRWPDSAIQTFIANEDSARIPDPESITDDYARGAIHLKLAGIAFRNNLALGMDAKYLADIVAHNLKLAMQDLRKVDYDASAGVLLNALERLQLEKLNSSEALVHFVEYFILARLRAQPRSAWAGALPSGGYLLGSKPADSELKNYPLPENKRIVVFLLPGEKEFQFKQTPLFRELRSKKTKYNSLVFTEMIFLREKAWSIYSAPKTPIKKQIFF